MNALRLSLGRMGGKGDAETGRLLEIISQEIERIEKSIEDFLNFTKPFEIKLSEVNVNQILSDTVALLEEKALRGSIVFKKDFKVLPRIQADEEALRRVFMNIIRNSIDASEEGGEIVVRAYATHARIEVTIQDKGKGIPREDLKRIFDPYFSRKRGGTGLGMSIAKRIIDRHHGHINVASEEGKGTTVTVSLPLHAESGEGVE